VNPIAKSRCAGLFLRRVGYVRSGFLCEHQAEQNDMGEEGCDVLGRVCYPSFR